MPTHFVADDDVFGACKPALIDWLDELRINEALTRSAATLFHLQENETMAVLI